MFFDSLRNIIDLGLFFWSFQERHTSGIVMPRRPAMPSKHANSPPPSISNIALLRQQWKWAAFSQFFYTFSPLFAMSDVTLNASINSNYP
jgi:hypothetical protein